MFPINTDFPKYESVIPDTNFTFNGDTPAVGTITYGPNATKNYVVAALGQGLHGLNINNTIEARNTNGVVTTVVGAEFLTTETQQYKKAWDGEKYVSYAVKTSTPQISGYRCGDVHAHKVPDLINFVRPDNDLDLEHSLVFKDHAIISGYDKYIYGYAMGRKSFIYSKGVGQSFKITFLNSHGSTTVTRKYVFKVERFGHFNTVYTAQTLVVDSGCTDANGAANSPDPACIITAGLPYLTASFDFNLHDFNNDGSKCLLALVIKNTQGLPDDDGVNSLDSWPCGWVEFTFTELNSIVSATCVVKKHYSTNSGTPTAISILRFNDGIPPSFGSNNKMLRELDPLKVNKIYVGAATESKQVRFTAPPQMTVYPYLQLPCKVYEWGTFPFKQIINSLGQTISPPIQDQGRYGNSGAVDFYILNADIGQSKYVSNAQTNNIKRCINIGYLNNSLYEAYTHYYSYSAVIDTTLDAGCTGNISSEKWFSNPGVYWTHSPTPGYWTTGSDNYTMNATGNYTIFYTTRRENYSCNFFGLIVNDAYIDAISSETAIGVSEFNFNKVVSPYFNRTTNGMDEYTYTVGYGSANAPPAIVITSSTTTTNLDTKQKILPSNLNITGPLNWGLNGILSIKKPETTIVGIRDTSVADVNSSGAWIQPFARMDSNTLISFNIGDGGYSVGYAEVMSGPYPYYPQSLVSGNHLRRTIVKLDGTLAVSTEGSHTTYPNPASDIPGGNHVCSYNFTTGECILNSATPASYI